MTRGLVGLYCVLLVAAFAAEITGAAEQKKNAAAAPPSKCITGST